MRLALGFLIFAVVLCSKALSQSTIVWCDETTTTTQNPPTTTSDEYDGETTSTESPTTTSVDDYECEEETTSTDTPTTTSVDDYECEEETTSTEAPTTTSIDDDDCEEETTSTLSPTTTSVDDYECEEETTSTESPTTTSIDDDDCEEETTSTSTSTEVPKTTEVDNESTVTFDSSSTPISSTITSSSSASTSTPDEPLTTTPPAPGTVCLAGWTRVSRRSGNWCVRVFEGTFDQAQAEVQCKTNGATISGAESPEERMMIAGLGASLMFSRNLTMGTIRMGFIRCDFTKKWTLTDRFTNGIEAFGWATGEPAKGSTSGIPNNCGSMWIGSSANNRNNGEFYTWPCTNPTTPAPNVFYGYACGIQAV